MRFISIIMAFSLLVAILPNVELGAESPDEVIDLWPNDPPGEKMDVGPEQDMTKDSDKLIAGRRIIKLGNVITPQAHVYLPPENIRTGAAVVICPGGGFTILAWDLEGTEVAQWLTTQGITAVVLKYRVPTRTQATNWLAPAQDAQRAISIIRSRADKYKLDKSKIGILGFSAGGTTAVKATFTDKRHYDAVDPADEEHFAANRVILIYAGGLPNPSDTSEDVEISLTPQSPPVFMVHTFDDFVPVQGTAHMLLAMKKAGVPCELHVYDAGGHGYGLRYRQDLPVTTWTKPCEDWLRKADWIYDSAALTDETP